ncbi:MAG: hypothetical protein NTY35_09105 [Planctomycetota bacterium]|nr:hypothetical protein [Planctomycetota bacterium]
MVDTFEKRERKRRQREERERKEARRREKSQSKKSGILIPPPKPGEPLVEPPPERAPI